MSDTRTNRLVLKIDSDGKGAVDTLNAINKAAEAAGKTLSGLASGKTRLTDIFAVSPQTLASQKANINLLVSEERGRAALARTATQEANARTAAARAVVQENNASAAAVKILTQENNARAAAARAAAAEARAAKAEEARQNRKTVFSGAASNVAAAAVGGVAGIAVTAATTAVARSINLAADSEKALNQLQFQSKATGDQMAAAAAKARELGADLNLPATSSVDAARAMLETSKAGFDLQESMDSARGSLALAAAAEIDAGEAANITASLLKAFNLEGNKSSHVADLLAASANNSLGEITDMAQAAQQASAVFHSAKFTVEDLTTDIALMANAGIKGSDAGTSLKTAVVALTAPTDQARAEMKRLHIEVYDGSGKLVTHDEIIKRVSKGLAGLSEEQRNAALKTIFGTDAIRAANIVFAAGVDKVEAMRSKVQQYGAATETAAAKNKGLKGSIDAFNSTLDSFGEKYGSKFLDPLTKSIGTISELIGVIDRAIERQNTFADGSKKAADNSLWSPDNVGRYVRETILENDKDLTKQESPEGRAAQARIDAQDLRKAKNTPFGQGDDSAIKQTAKKYGVELNRAQLSPYFLADQLEAAAQGADKKYNDFNEESRIGRLQSRASKGADEEKRRLEGRNARESNGTFTPIRHVDTAADEKAREKARKAAEKAARASERAAEKAQSDRERRQRENAHVQDVYNRAAEAVKNANAKDAKDTQDLDQQTRELRAKGNKAARDAKTDQARADLDAITTSEQIKALTTGAQTPAEFKKKLSEKISDLDFDIWENIEAQYNEAIKQLEDVRNQQMKPVAGESFAHAEARERNAETAFNTGKSEADRVRSDATIQLNKQREAARGQVSNAARDYAETIKQNNRKAAEVMRAFWEGESQRIDQQMRQAEQQNDFATQNKLVSQRLAGQIEQASQEFYLGLMENDPAQVTEALNHFNQATDDAAVAMDDIKRRTQARIDAMGPKNEVGIRLRGQADPWARGRNRFFVDEQGNTRDRKRTDGSGAPRRVDGAQVQFMQDLTQAASKGSSDFMRALFSGDKNDNALKDIGKHLGQDFANAGADFLQRKLVDGPLNRLFDGIADHLQDSLMKGGGAAGQAIGDAAMLLFAIYNLSGKNGKKKQRNAMIGAVVGGIAGSFAGDWAHGAQMGAAVGGAFAKGGRYPVGRNIWVGEDGPELVKIDRPGEIIPNHKVGDYLDLGSLMPQMPSFGGTPSLAPSATRALQNMAATVASGGTGGAGGYGDVAQSITIFGGVHGDKAVGRAGKTWGSSLQDAVAMR